MSKGYIPKKVREARRKRRLRRRYKYFTCQTCYHEKVCFKRLNTGLGTQSNTKEQDCVYWKLSEEAKYRGKNTNLSDKSGKKQTCKKEGFFSGIFKKL